MRCCFRSEQYSVCALLTSVGDFDLDLKNEYVWYICVYVTSFKFKVFRRYFNQWIHSATNSMYLYNYVPLHLSTVLVWYRVLFSSSRVLILTDFNIYWRMIIWANVLTSLLEWVLYIMIIWINIYRLILLELVIKTMIFVHVSCISCSSINNFVGLIWMFSIITNGIM